MTVRKVKADTMRTILAGAAAVALAVALVSDPRWALAQDEGPVPERITFMSADGRTRLVGYLYKPALLPALRVPAVVMMHGRAGAYSDRANGVYDASTLSLRHKAWGREWADAGYVAILVDGFGPRGHPQGFPRFSYDSRPAEVDEVTVRPLDAYGALAYLRSRPDVIADRIGLQGWSNGGSAAIAAMSADAPGIASPTSQTGFRAALAFYPACGLKGRFDREPFRPYAPTLILHGTADEEVSYRRCAALVEKGRAAGGAVELKLYRGATHSFDSPGRKRQSVEANSAATEDAIDRSLRHFARYLGTPARP
jgi:carboxymethylenebutenolidase